MENLIKLFTEKYNNVTKEEISFLISTIEISAKNLNISVVKMIEVMNCSLEMREYIFDSTINATHELNKIMSK